MTATDSDPSRPGNLVYGIEGAFASDRFRIDVVDGVNTVASLKKPLDRDFPGGYPIWPVNVVASDENGSPQTSRKGYGILNIILRDINDNSPIFDTCCITGFLPENEVGKRLQILWFESVYIMCACRLHLGYV